MLEDKVSSLPATVSASAVEKVKDTIKGLAAFDVVVHRCWGMTLKGDYKEAINVFCRMYRALPNITFPPKFHIVEKEVVIFLERKQAKGYTNIKQVLAEEGVVGTVGLLVPPLLEIVVTC